MSSQVQLPRFLAKMINGIGELTLSTGYVYIVPAPEPNPAEANTRLIHVVTQNVMTQFNSFIRDATAAGLILTDQLSSVTTGTHWWILKATDSVTHAAADNVNSVVCYF